MAVDDAPKSHEWYRKTQRRQMSREKTCFLGSMPRDGTPIQLNGNIAVACVLLKVVAAFTAEAEFGALFMNSKKARVTHLILVE